jgi:hypothetical protein
LRKKIGIDAESLLIAESTEEGILLRPAVALPVEVYSRVGEIAAVESTILRSLHLFVLDLQKVVALFYRYEIDTHTKHRSAGAAAIEKTCRTPPPFDAG